VQLVECGKGLLVAALRTLNQGTFGIVALVRPLTESRLLGGAFIGVAEVVQVATVISLGLRVPKLGFQTATHGRVLTFKKITVALKGFNNCSIVCTSEKP
jgi:hypothetical protein